MIIKSMARKQPSFGQLVEYLNKDSACEQTINHNLYSHGRSTPEELVDEFDKNADFLPKRKNGNYLYHEIISFEETNIPASQLDSILLEIGELYLSERAPGQLAYGVIHKDTDKPHIHFCISANDAYSTKRQRLNKADFRSLQGRVESYVHERFPLLDNRVIYNKARDKERLKSTNKEQALKQRTGKLSKKEVLKNTLHGLFELANSKKELDTILSNQGFKLYTRGKNVGVEKLDTGQKHRLATLGVIDHYLSALARFDSLEKTQRLQANSPQKNPEKDRKTEPSIKPSQRDDVVKESILEPQASVSPAKQKAPTNEEIPQTVFTKKPAERRSQPKKEPLKGKVTRTAEKMKQDKSKAPQQSGDKRVQPAKKQRSFIKKVAGLFTGKHAVESEEKPSSDERKTEKERSEQFQSVPQHAQKTSKKSDRQYTQGERKKENEQAQENINLDTEASERLAELERITKSKSKHRDKQR